MLQSCQDTRTICHGVRSWHANWWGEREIQEQSTRISLDAAVFTRFLEINNLLLKFTKVKYNLYIFGVNVTINIWCFIWYETVCKTRIIFPSVLLYIEGSIIKNYIRMFIKFLFLVQWHEAQNNLVDHKGVTRIKLLSGNWRLHPSDLSHRENISGRPATLSRGVLPINGHRSRCPF